MSAGEHVADGRPRVRATARLLWRRGAAGVLALRKRPESTVALQAAGIWLATRVALALITYFAVTFATTNHGASVPPSALLASWWRKDVAWYLSIAQYGYWHPTAATFARDHGASPTAFFPLYPMLVAALTFVLGASHRLLAGMLVSNLGVLAAFVGLGLLAAHDAQDDTDQRTAARTAARTVLLAAAAPLAFFLAAAYSDSLFFALAVFALLAARRGAWRWAIVCGVLAGLDRFTAVILVLPLAWEYATQHGWHPRLPHLPPRRAGAPDTGTRLARAFRAVVASIATHIRESGAAIQRDRRAGWRGARVVALGAAVAAAAPVGIGLYASFLWWRFGDPLAFLRAEQQGWKHALTAPWLSIPHAIFNFFTLPPWSFNQARSLVDYGMVLFCAAVTIIAWRRLSGSYRLYMLALLYLSIASPVTWSSDIFISAGRYLLPAIPVYLVLGRWAGRSATLDALLVGGGFALQGLFTGLWLAVNIGFI